MLSCRGHAGYGSVGGEHPQIFPIPSGQPPGSIDHDLVVVKPLALDDCTPLVLAEGVVSLLILYSVIISHLKWGHGSRMLRPSCPWSRGLSPERLPGSSTTAYQGCARPGQEVPQLSAKECIGWEQLGVTIWSIAKLE